MTRPRLFPDQPRLCPEVAWWAIAAKRAGASIWQIAVYTQFNPSTLYALLRRHRRPGEARHMRPSTPPEAAAAQRANRRRYEEAEARQLAQCEAVLAAEEAARQPQRIRCECGGIVAVGVPHICHWRSAA